VLGLGAKSRNLKAHFDQPSKSEAYLHNFICILNIIAEKQKTEKT
jgi:hypothetical protein